MSNNTLDNQELPAGSQMLRSLTEELKLPLLQIARQAELLSKQAAPAELAHIRLTAESALRLVDCYALSAQLMHGQQQLELQPVSVSAALYDTTQYLHDMSKLYDCEVRLSIKGRPGLVMAHPAALQAALLGLGYSFIAAAVSGGKGRITLTAKRTAEGVQTGILAQNNAASRQVLSSMKNSSRQPLAQLTHSSGSGVLIAESLFKAMTVPMHIIRARKDLGVAGILLSSKQLALL